MRMRVWRWDLRSDASPGRLCCCRGAQGQGQYIKYLTMRGVLWRFATARRRKGRFVPEGSGGGGGGGGGYQRLAAHDASS